jgi:hypothetical protein
MISGDTHPRPGALRVPEAPAAERTAPTRRTGPAVRFWWVFLGFAALLLFRSRELFTRVIIEEGDAAANSILVEQAKQFSQLVGNYSRIGFHHPGPGFLYVQALGEWGLYDRLGVVPSPWNGQAIAILLLNAGLVALAVTIVCRRLTDGAWLPAGARLATGAWLLAGVGGAALLYFGTHYDLVTSTWPPFAYFPPYLLLLAAAASVATGGVRDLWALALAGGLLVHGHAEFLFLATLPVLASVGVLLRRNRGGVRRLLRDNRRHLVVAGAVLAVLALPIVVNLLRNWPGEFGKYLSYGKGHSANPVWAAAWYAFRVWDDQTLVAIPMAVLLFAAAVVAVRASGHPYLRAGLAFAVLGVGSFLLYAIIGIDSLTEYYIGFFTRAVPLFLILLAVAAVVGRTGPAGRYLGVGLAVAGLVAALGSPALVNRRLEVPDVPAALAVLTPRLAPGQPLVVRVAPIESWAEAVPLALSGHRRGLRVCFTNQSLRLEATPAYLCSNDEIRTGLPVTVARDGHDPAGLVRIADLNKSAVWASTP